MDAKAGWRRVVVVVGAAAVCAGAVCVAAVLWPKGGSADPSATRTIVTRVVSREGPSDGTTAEQLEKAGTLRTDLADAASHLTFAPALPADIWSRGALIGIYTFAERDGLPNAEGRDSSLDALYENDLQVIQKQWDPKVVDSEVSFRALVTQPFGTRADEVVRSVDVDGVTVLVWDPVALPEKVDEAGDPLPGVYYGSAQVSWFSDGVGHMVASPNHTGEELLDIAKTMIK